MESGNDTGMNETHISFYLRSFRIHLFVDALRGIGSPRFIQFLVGPSGTSLAMVPADKKGFRTHRVPKGIYEGQNQMEINSMGLCRLIANRHGWNMNCSYRIPGVVSTTQKAAVFDFTKAQVIESKCTTI